MGVLARLLSRRFGLEPRYAYEVHRDVRVPGDDGRSLLTDVYMPRGLDRGPTVLIRSPYGRRPFGLSMAGPLAGQGYVAVVQSCRGTAGSEGGFDPHHDEHRDGLAAVEWIKAQPFFDGSIVTYGMSYLGYTQWAIAAEAGPEVKAMAMQVTLSDFSRMTYSGDSLMLENALSWTQLVTRMKTLRGKLRLGMDMLFGRDSIAPRQWRELPLETLDERVTGQRVPFWRDWMEHCSHADPWWEPMNFHRTISDVRRPVSLVAGWHDIFTPWTLRDFEALQRAGAPRRVTVGPWRHTDAELGKVSLRDAVDWFAHHTGGPESPRSEPVRLFVMQADEWRHFDQWPPKEAEPTSWYLQAGGALERSPAPESPPEHYRYDPADPTPSVGGPALASVPHSVDNRALEARSDVLCFTSPPLDDALDVIGVPSAELHVESSAPSADFFVRLCDVDEAGVSLNVCDGLQRVSLRGGSGPQPVRIELWPTAYRFRRGHRLRVQVSSGAFPRWARNLGTAEPAARGTELRPADQAVHHGPDAPSRLCLPLVPATRSGAG